jgi:hypothetical protein
MSYTISTQWLLGGNMESFKKLSAVLEYLIGIIGAISIIVSYLNGSEGILFQRLSITGIALILGVVLYHFVEKKRGNYYDAKVTCSGKCDQVK